MSDILNKTIVLVLNRNWQAINIRTPQDAFCQMATNVATALDIEFDDAVEPDSFRTPRSEFRASGIRPVQWDEWITLPVREDDHAVRTARGAIRVPTVVVAVNFAKVPKKRPKPCSKTIRERDGNRCQYTGKLLKPDEGSLDHVLPRSRGRPGHVGKLRVVEQAGERPQGQPSAARSRPETARLPARAEGTAGDGAPPQRPRHRGMETVPERMKPCVAAYP